MKCHCKYCLPRFFCQTKTLNDFCYYRYSKRANLSDDFGCVENDVATFLCNTTDVNYRTECCSSFFCNTLYQIDNRSTSPSTTISIQQNYPLKTIILLIISCLIVFGLLSLMIYHLFKRSKSKINFDNHSIETISWNSQYSDQDNSHVLLETRRINKELAFRGQLGQGRHARVRLASIGQQYRAIKMFETRFQNEFERERTIYETDLIQHPNILAFFGADFYAKGTETFHILIFEWHPLGTLDDVLKKDQQILTKEKLFQYSISLADGLAHLHSMKYGTNDICKPQMAHCDIKSSNILVKLNGDCCLSDFSLAVRCHPQTNEILGGGLERLYHRVGTKLYMPPELLNQSSQFHFDRINAYQQGDMYSLALVFWEIGNCYCSLIHIRPYENLLPMNFTIENLVRLVCLEEKRPKSCLISSDQILQSFFNLLDFYWCQDPCARQSAANLQDQLRQLRSTLV